MTPDLILFGHLALSHSASDIYFGVFGFLPRKRVHRMKYVKHRLKYMTRPDGTARNKRLGWEENTTVAIHHTTKTPSAALTNPLSDAKH
jgi:hypothetical protein